MTPEDVALYTSLPTDHPFRVVISRVMVDFYVGHSTDIQKRIFHQFLLRLPSLPASSEDWRVFALCNKPSSLGGANANQCVGLFWAKIAEMLNRVQTPEETKEVIRTSEDVFPGDFWDDVYKSVFLIVAVVGTSLYYLLTFAATTSLSLFWNLLPGAANLVTWTVGLYSQRASALIASAARGGYEYALLEVPVVAEGVVWVGWQASAGAVLHYFLNLLFRAYARQLNGLAARAAELPLPNVLDVEDNVFALDPQVKFLDTEQIRQFRDHLQYERERTQSFKPASAEDLRREREFNEELRLREAEPIATDIRDPESGNRATTITSDQQRAEIIRIQREIRQEVEAKSTGFLTPEETASAIRNEALDIWLVEHGLQPSNVNDLPAGNYREFRLARQNRLTGARVPGGELFGSPSGTPSETPPGSRRSSVSNVPSESPRVSEVLRELELREEEDILRETRGLQPREPREEYKGELPRRDLYNVPEEKMEFLGPIRRGQTSPLADAIRDEFPDLSDEEAQNLANDYINERTRLMRASREGNLNNVLRETETALPQMGPNLEVASARRILFRRLHGDFEQFAIREPPNLTAPSEAVLLPEAPVEVVDPLLLEELQLGPRDLVLREVDLIGEGPFPRPALPEAAPLRFGLTAARLEGLALGAQLVTAVAFLIVGIILIAEENEARNAAQLELNKAAREYDQKFDALAVELGYSDLPAFHRDLRGVWDYDAENPMTEIPRLFRYGEAGLAYLQFRKDYQPKFPSIEQGLNNVEELWKIISGGYLRLYPGQIVVGYLPIQAIIGLDWRDAVRKYNEFSDERRAYNQKAFEQKYLDLLRTHGDSPDPRINFKENEPSVYWSNYFVVPDPETALPESLKRAKALSLHVDELLPLFLLYFPFEKSRTSITARSEYTKPELGIPDVRFLKFHWFLQSTNARLSPTPQLPSLANLSALVGEASSPRLFVHNALGRYGTYSYTRDGNLIAYSVPALSLIVLANSSQLGLLTPPSPGNVTTLNGLQCNTMPVYYELQGDTILLGLESQALTFEAYRVTRSQVGSNLYIPVAPRNFQRPTNNFASVSPQNQAAGVAYLIMLNARQLERQMQALPGEVDLRPEWVDTEHKFLDTKAFAFGTQDVGIVQSDPDSFSVTVTDGDRFLNIRQAAYIASFVTFFALYPDIPPGFWTDALRSLTFVVTWFSPLKEITNQMIVLPLVDSVPVVNPTSVALTTAASWPVVRGFVEVVPATIPAEMFSWSVVQVGKEYSKLVPAASLLGYVFNLQRYEELQDAKLNLVERYLADLKEGYDAARAESKRPIDWSGLKKAVEDARRFANVAQEQSANALRGAGRILTRTRDVLSKGYDYLRKAGQLTADAARAAAPYVVPVVIAVGSELYRASKEVSIAFIGVLGAVGAALIAAASTSRPSPGTRRKSGPRRPRKRRR